MQKNLGVRKKVKFELRIADSAFKKLTSNVKRKHALRCYKSKRVPLVKQQICLKPFLIAHVHINQL